MINEICFSIKCSDYYKKYLRNSKIFRYESSDYNAFLENYIFMGMYIHQNILESIDDITKLYFVFIYL